MGLIVDDSVMADPADDAADLTSAAEYEAEPNELGPLEAVVSPPAPPPDQSDLLDESEPLATSAAQLLNVQSQPPPPPSEVSQALGHELEPGPVARRSPSPPATAPRSPSSAAPTLSSNEPGPARRVRGTSPGEHSVALPAPPGSSSRHSAPDRGSNPQPFARTGHPVRDRLLARAANAGPVARSPAPALGNAPGPGLGAAQAKVRDSVPQPPSLAAGFSKGEPLPAFSSLEAFGDELDEIAAPKASGAPIRIAGATLSSGSLLMFGTILGLAAVASLFTLLIQFAPQHDAAKGDESAAIVPPSDAVTPNEAPAPLLLPPERKHVQGPWRIIAATPGQKRVEGDIGRDPFLKAIQAVGVSTNEAYRVFAALKAEKNLDRCRPKDHFIALIDRASSRVLAFEYIVNKEEIYQAREGKDGLLKGIKLDLEVKKERVQGSLIFSGGSFDDAARAAHLEPTLGQIVNRALDGHTSILQFQRGDRLRLVAQEVTVLGEFSRYAGIEALEYVPVNGKPLRIYYYPTRKKYYDAQGRAPGEGGWRRPVRGAPITSKFNPNRMHPILKKRMPHTGTDFGAPTGSTVYASSYGVISKLGVYGPNGNFIGIQHDHGYETGYSHLSRFEPGLKAGDKVSRAQVIGYVGSTGRSTGPHLHFSAKKDGVFIDAESLHLDALTVLPPEDRAGFALIRSQYEALLEAVPLLPPLNEPAAPAANSAANEVDLEAGEGVDPGAAAPAVDPAVADPAEADIGGPDEPSEMGAAAVPVARAPAPAQPAPLPGLPAAPRPGPAEAPRNAAAFYLSDKELMEQPPSDDGEVER